MQKNVSFSIIFSIVSLFSRPFYSMNLQPAEGLDFPKPEFVNESNKDFSLKLSSEELAALLHGLILKNDQKQIISFLYHYCDKKKEILNINYNGQNAMHTAIENGNLSIVALFHTVDPALIFTLGKNGQSTLHTTVFSDSGEIAKWLIKEKINVLEIDNKGMTAFHLAASANAFSVSEALMNCNHIKEKLFSATDKENLTPLMITVKYNNDSMFKYLLEEGANPFEKSNIKTDDLNNIVYYHKPIMYYIIENGGRLNVLKELIKKHPNIINQQDQNGNTPVHYAAQFLNLEILEWLLNENKIEIKSLKNNETGNTPLHSACGLLFEKGVQLLIKKFPELKSIKNNDGKTPIERIGYNQDRINNLKSGNNEKIKDNIGSFTAIKNLFTLKNEKNTVISEKFEYNPKIFNELMKNTNSKNSQNKKKKKAPKKETSTRETPKKENPPKKETLKKETPDNDINDITEEFNHLSISNDLNKKYKLPTQRVKPISIKEKTIKRLSEIGHTFEKQNNKIIITDISRTQFNKNIQPSIIELDISIKGQKNYLLEITKYAGSAEWKNKTNDYYHTFSKLVEVYGDYGTVHNYTDYINPTDKLHLHNCTEKLKVVIKGTLVSIHTENKELDDVGVTGKFEFILLKNTSETVCIHRFFVADKIHEKK